MTEEKFTNCICNTDLDRQHRNNLVALINGFQDARAICRKARKHNFKFWKVVNERERFQCTVCGVLKNCWNGGELDESSQ